MCARRSLVGQVSDCVMCDVFAFAFAFGRKSAPPPPLLLARVQFGKLLCALAGVHALNFILHTENVHCWLHSRAHNNKQRLGLTWPAGQRTQH